MEKQCRHNITNIAILFFAAIVLHAGIVQSQPYHSALGIASEFRAKDYTATGASFVFFFSKKSAVEITALTGNSGYYLSLLYQYHFPLDNKKQLHGYIGAGAFNVIYPRGTIGVHYKPATLPLDFSIDWRPIYEFRVDDDIDNSGLKHFGISIRYVLKK
jgi:outer membrane protein W